MKAAIRTGLLGYTFSLVDNYVKPLFKPSSTHRNQVYIKVKSAGINPVDYKLPRLAGGKVIGIDFCGTIEQIGDDVDSNEYKIGDDVFGSCSSGSLAEYCIADSNRIAKVPSSSTDWTSSECAALPVAYVSALQSLRTGKIVSEEDNSNKSVLIIGASGGCGIAGIQLCRAMGVGRIVGICSSNNIDFVKEAGGGETIEVICYNKEDEFKTFFDENVGKFDCVYDAATNSGGGEDYWNKSQKLLKFGESHGDYVSLNGPASKWFRAFAKKQKPHQSLIMANTNTADFKLILSLMNKANSKPIINAIPLSEEGLATGFRMLKSRRTKGKIVFNMG